MVNLSNLGDFSEPPKKTKKKKTKEEPQEETPQKKRPGPKKGQSGRKSRVWTPKKINEIRRNEGKWVILIEGATVNQNSNAIQWTKRHPGFKTVCRSMETNPPDAPLTIFARYSKEEEENG